MRSYHAEVEAKEAAGLRTKEGANTSAEGDNSGDTAVSGHMETFPSVVVAGLVPATPIAMALCLHTLLLRRALIFGVAGTSSATTAQV
jgi:hypothetical protein